MKHPDDDVRRLMEKESSKNVLLSYLISLAYAAVAAVAGMAGREMIEATTRKLLAHAALEVNQYSGYARLSTILGLGLMAVLWLGTFLIVWNRVEKAETLKARLRTGARWIQGAALLYLIFSLVQLLAVGYWPLLSGGV